MIERLVVRLIGSHTGTYIAHSEYLNVSRVRL